MTGLDTNVLIRFLTGDDPIQSQVASRLFKVAESENSSFFISACVLLECMWVLDSNYQFSRKEILESMQNLFRLPYLQFENNVALSNFFGYAENSTTELSDCLIGAIAKSNRCKTILTFDKHAVRDLDAFQLLKA